jgi:hemerythrin
MAKSWSDDLITGVRIVDVQHRQLFARADRMIATDPHDCPENECREMIEFLRQYVKHHFSTEESLITTHAYPNMDLHQRQNRWFEEQFTKIEREGKEKGADAHSHVQVSYFLIDWFKNHIQVVDRKLTEYLKGKLTVSEPRRSPAH